METVLLPFIWLFKIIWWIISGFFQILFFLSLLIIAGITIIGILSVIIPTVFQFRCSLKGIENQGKVYFFVKIGGGIFSVLVNMEKKHSFWKLVVLGKSFQGSLLQDNATEEISTPHSSYSSETGQLETETPVPITLNEEVVPFQEENLDIPSEIFQESEEKIIKSDVQTVIVEDEIVQVQETPEYIQPEISHETPVMTDELKETVKPPVKEKTSEKTKFSMKKEIIKEIKLFARFLIVYFRRNRRNWFPLIKSSMKFTRRVFQSFQWNPSSLKMGFGFADPRITGWVTGLGAFLAPLCSPKMEIILEPEFMGGVKRIPWLEFVTECYELDLDSDVEVQLNGIQIVWAGILFVLNWRLWWFTVNTVFSWGIYSGKRGWYWYKLRKA